MPAKAAKAEKEEKDKKDAKDTKDAKGKKGAKDAKGKGEKPPEEEPVAKAKPKIDYPLLPTRKWIPPDERPRKKKIKVVYQAPSNLTVPAALLRAMRRPQPHYRPKPKINYPPLDTKKWIRPDKRVKKKKERKTVEYPPLTLRTWVPPDQRKKKKKTAIVYKIPSKIKLEISSLTPMWNNFEYIDGERILLVAHYSQFYKKYGFKSNGYQAPCNCVAACAFSQMFDIKKWTPFVLDKILDVGDKLYQESIRMQLEKDKKELKYSDVYHTYFIDNFRLTMDMKGERVSGRLLPETEEVIHFLQVATPFLKVNNFAVVVIEQKKFFAVWFLERRFFVFDPCEYDAKGDISKAPIGRGFSVLLGCKALEKIRDFMMVTTQWKQWNPPFVLISCNIARKFEINTKFPECLEDANLELRALSDAEKQKMEEEQIQKLKERGALPPPPPPDPNEIMVEDDFEELPVLIEELEEEEDEEGGDQGMVPEVQKVKPPDESDNPEEEEPPKFTIKKVKPPPEKVKPTSMTYFRELKSNEVGILRASVHQGDERFRRCAGKQSITMAVSAVAMLRIYKSKYWTQTVLDEVLRNGNNFYRASKKAYPTEPVMKITTLCNTIKLNDKEFAPKIEEFSVVGKLGSDDGEILDLQPALKEFFSEHDTCIILGPLTLATWCEKGIFYMFDPNERDEKGMRIQRIVQVASEFQVISAPEGTACLVWFSNLKELCDVYLRNIEADQRREQFILCKIQLDDYFPLAEDYRNFKAVSSTRWTLKGTFSQNNKKFAENIRNTQCTAIAAFAIAMNKMKIIKLWNTELMDEVVEVGSRYYEECINTLQARNKFVNRLLMVDELNPTFRYNDKEVKFDFQSCTVNGKIDNEDTDKIPNLKMGLKEFFEIACCGILTCRGIAIAVFCLETYYYYFDSHTRNDQGLPSFYGTSFAIRTNTVEELTDLILANLSADTNNLYNISRVGIEIYEGTGIPRPPLNHFVALDINRAILRSKFSERDERFGITAGKQSICMNISALGMSYVIPTLTWDVDILEKAMDLGNELYIQTMEQVLEDEEKGRIVDVPPPAPVVEVKIEEPKEEEKDKKERRKPRGRRGKEAEEAPPPAPPPPPEPEKKAISIVEEDAAKDEITSENVIKSFTIGINKFDLEFDTKEGTYQDLEATLRDIYIPEPPPGDEREPTVVPSILKNSPIAPGTSTSDDDHDRKLYLIESKHMTCVMWKEDGVYFLFDPKPRDETGQVYGREEWLPIYTKRRRKRVYTDYTTDTGGGGDMMSDTAATISEKTDKTSEKTVDKSEKSDDLSKLVGGREYKGPDLFSETEMYEDEEEEYLPLLKKHSSNYWREKEKNGKACVLRFIYPEDLVRHVVRNTPPLLPDLPYKLTAIQLTNTALQKEVYEDESGAKSGIKNVGDWNNFKEIDKGRWILRGTTTETSDTFPEFNRGRQCNTVAFLALSFQHLYSLPVFKNQTVDDILMYGDRLFTFSYEMIKKVLQEDPYKTDEEKEKERQAEAKEEDEKKEDEKKEEEKKEDEKEVDESKKDDKGDEGDTVKEGEALKDEEKKEAEKKAAKEEEDKKAAKKKPKRKPKKVEKKEEEEEEVEEEGEEELKKKKKKKKKEEKKEEKQEIKPVEIKEYVPMKPIQKRIPLRREHITNEFCIGGDMITIDVEDKKVMGEIHAEDQEKLLDVKRGLEEFFRVQSTGIIEAKELMVAVWKKGQSYYMCDPHSRGPSGAQCVNGVACITRFIEIEPLAKLFLANLTTDGDNRFYIHAIHLESAKCPREEVRKVKPKLKAPTPNVTGFVPISPGRAIIHGAISQQDQQFRRQLNAQFAPMALVALAMTLVHNPLFWTKPIIDEIVLIGDNLYSNALDALGYTFNPWENPLTLELTPTNFTIGELKASCEIRENEQTGIVEIKHSKVLNLRQGLEEFFKENTHGVIVTDPLTLAIWEEDEPKKTLYMFDPCPRGISGMPSYMEVATEGMATCKGAACVLTFDSYKSAADHFTALLTPDTYVEFTVKPVEICVGKMKTRGKDKKKRKEELPLAIIGTAIGKMSATDRKQFQRMEKKKLRKMIKAMRRDEEAARLARVGRKNFYNLPGNEMAILRGTRSQYSKYYCSLSRGYQDIPNCLTAYVMERLLPFNQWTGEVINMVLDIGDQLYKDSCILYRPENKCLELDSVIRDIVIRDVRVNIAIGKPVLLNQFSVVFIEKALEMFFRQKMYCMFKICANYLALFCKDDLYYMFDPHGLNLEGKAVPCSEASLMKFANLRKMAEVIFENYKEGEEEEQEMIFSMILVAIKAIQKLPRKKPTKDSVDDFAKNVECDEIKKNCPGFSLYLTRNFEKI